MSQLSLFDDTVVSKISEPRISSEQTFPAAPMYVLRLAQVGDYPTGKRTQVRSPEDVASLFFDYFKDKPHEEFFIVLLNTAHVVTGVVQISIGGLAASIVEPRAVFGAAVDGSAASIIAVHQHPSHNPEPSKDDVRITRQLLEAGKIMGIPMLDHVIIAGTRFTSLAERGLLG